MIILLFILTIGPTLHQYTINQFPIHFHQLWANISGDHMHWWFQQCPLCKVALSVRLLPCDQPVATDSQYQLHGRLHQHSVILFLNRGELQWPSKREYHSCRYERWKPTPSTLYEQPSHSSLEQQYKLQHVDMGIQYVTEVVASDVSTSHHQSFRVPSWAQQTMDRVLTVPQLLDTIFSILGYTPNPLYSRLGQRSHLMCFDSMLVIFNGFSIYQLFSETKESRHLYKFPD